ncbi:BPTF [Cordylochernes scorpioides]|uniref:BPTF n=1 Tax=Cordylochernes scorpioides TaxID=51811 RepID=A0ABY6LEZ7_9ARAC|nr:BPTF [Cordylochernes scorpioides]UYV79249.1 BPTF [Cordylochernes scorpioides]
MSGRGRRGRGRPPKRPNASQRSNLLKMPRYLYAGSSNLSSRSSTPIKSGDSSPHQNYRGKLRGKVNKSKNLFQNNFQEYEYNLHDLGPSSSEDESDAYQDEDIYETGNVSDFSCDSDNASVYSHSSFSTISSANAAPIRRRLIRRPHTPVFLQDRQFPPLVLPKSSEDLLMPNKHLMQVLGIYEILRHFRHNLRLTPFRFEDFCVALSAEEQCILISEIHIMLLKAILREEDSMTTLFGPLDLRDSINIHLYLIDNMTWPEVLKMYFQSDPEYIHVLDAFEDGDYPYISLENKIRILQLLCDIFLATTPARDEIISEGVIAHDDHCRNCHKLGDLLCCETCPAVYHLACVDPPLADVPTEDWMCAVCKSNQVSGVTDCISEIEKNGLLSRQELLGMDRRGRKFWFMCRRIFM